MAEETTATRSRWSGKWAFILAAAASAVGLGNLWRFPYLAAKYGGGTFLFIYILLVATIGLSLLILETAIGRQTGLSAIGAFKKFGNKYSIIGIIVAIVPAIITPYYSIIGGWVFKYMVAYVTDAPAAIADGGGFFTNFITSGTESFLFMAVFMAIAFIIVALGVKGGIEKANLVMMPALLVMAVGLVIFTLMQPGAMEGAVYYLSPDFTKLSPELFIGALGQVFYSMSLAMAIIITYGSYLSKKESITYSSVRVAGFDLLVSFLAGLMIVPAAFMALGSAEVVSENAGPGLMFVVLPQLFESLGGAAPIIGFVFFLLVLFAALTSTISLTEACVSLVQDGLHWSRKRSLIATFLFIFIAGIFVNAGYSSLSFIEPLGEGTSLLDFFDFISNSVLMPIAATLTCLFAGWWVGNKIFIEEIEQTGEFKLKGAWNVIIKYIAPVFMIIILITYTAQTLGFISI